MDWLRKDGFLIFLTDEDGVDYLERQGLTGVFW